MELQDMGTGSRGTHTTKTQFAFIEFLKRVNCVAVLKIVASFFFSPAFFLANATFRWFAIYCWLVTSGTQDQQK